ncbi:hypothetical protein NA57DRAFT_48886 [Rhizodiscina lignyota]|uniref:RING-CH-type domain-containing protein n=1 Tax=Rhizodiscina lignyota TaxID=1504668 RepID=A0A9P4I7H2_9PEZI|nr:hypothetical protein NA57DRAFT_48886 [Rhizodiscina lignyota]
MDTHQRKSAPGGWDWPDDIGESGRPGHTSSAEQNGTTQPPEPTGTTNDSNQRRKTRTHWPPRTCRICLETVQPTFHPPSETLPSMFQGGPNVTYESEEGRLIRPCKCKGSQRYVHDGCLQAWRHADPSYGRRNYWQCPTCGFRYRLDRMSWGRVISSTAAQIILTVTVLVFVMFILGFVGDYILDLYLDPWNTISPFGERPDYSLYDNDEPSTWIEHFLKGLASLGLLSFFKLFFSPTRFFFRWGGNYGRQGRTGRDRLADISWIMVVIGVVTFLWSVWKGTRALSRRYLNKVAERVLDVQGDDDDDDDD